MQNITNISSVESNDKMLMAYYMSQDKNFDYNGTLTYLKKKQKINIIPIVILKIK